MTKKSFLITAFVLILAGGLLFLFALSRVGFDVKKFGSRSYETEEIPLTEPFTSIRTDLMDCSVTLNVDPFDRTRAVLTCSEDSPVTLTVEGGVLTVTQKDTRPWYRRVGFFEFGGASVELYLPHDLRPDLHAESMSGDFRAGGLVGLGAAQVKTVSGDIEWNGASADKLEVRTSSGDISLDRASVPRGITVDTTSGDVSLNDCTAAYTLLVHTTSGDIQLKNVSSDGPLTVETVSGELKAESVTAENVVNLKSTSGDFLLGDFIVHETCHIKTTSGDVHFLRSSAEDFKVQTVSGDVTGTLLTEADHQWGKGDQQGMGWSVTTTSGYVHIYPAE